MTNEIKKDRVKTFIICLLIGYLLKLVFPIYTALPPQWHTLQIIANGEKNPASSSTVITLMDIQDENDIPYNLDSFEKTDNWINEEEYLSSPEGTQALLSYRFEHRNNMAFGVVFQTGPDVGKAIVKLDNKTQTIDLFEPRTGITIHHITVPYTRYPWLILFYGADIISMAILIYILWSILLPSKIRSWIKTRHKKLLLILIFISSAYKTYRSLIFYTTRPLSFDVAGYIQMAEKMSHPFDTGIREPVWIWLVKVFYSASGNHEYGIHILGILLFILSNWLLYRLVVDLFHNHYLAIATVAIYAVNPFVIDIAVQGLRDVMNQFTILGMSYFVFVKGEHLSQRKRISGLTLFFILSIGTTLSNVAAFSILLLFGFWRNRINLKYLLVPIGFTVLFILPYLVYCQQIYNDPFFASNTHAVYWRNYEFVSLKRTGCAGCPTPDELAKSSYAGEPTNTLSYLFGLHSTNELVTGTIQGFIALFFSPSKKFFNFIGVSDIRWFYIYLIGLIVYIYRHRRHWLLLLVPVLVTNFTAFMIFMTGRIFSANTPFICIVTGMGITWLLSLLHASINQMSGLLSGVITKERFLSSLRSSFQINPTSR